MNKHVFLLLAYFTVTIGAFGQNSVSDNPILNFQTNTITEKGAWCWFADPRAIHYKNEKGTIDNTYIGYIDTHGNIKATQINHLTNTTNEVLIRSYFQPDDHNNPTFLVLPDERVMIFYSRHTDEPYFYYRISGKKGDITTLGKEVRLATTHNTTYPSPFILSDDPGHIYLAWRGINWHPTIARLTLPDANGDVKFDWGPHQIVRSKKDQGNGIRPYAKYMSNGKDKIYLTYTTTHPDNQSVNYIYFNYVDINTKELKDVKGNSLSVVGGDVLHDVDATKKYKDSHPYAVVDDTPVRNWLGEVSADKEGKPVIAMVSISEDKKSHDYYHVRWTGSKWQKTFIANGGGHFHQSPGIENCYSGGMALDKTDPQVIYGSVPVDGKYGRVYELKKYTVGTDGTVGSAQQLTFDSPKNNIRPFMLEGKTGENSLGWMYGDYYDWIVSAARPRGYATAVRTSMNIPTSSIDLKKRLLVNKAYAKVAPADKHKIAVSRSKAFTLALTMSLDTAAYHGQLVKFAGLTYNVPEEERAKPYLQSGDKIYASTNVLGNSDVWQKKKRGTNGQWYTPSKLETFQLAISYENGVLRTYIDGLIDQSVEIPGLQLSDVTVGGFSGVVKDLKIYGRVLSQDEIKALRKNLLSAK